MANTKILLRDEVENLGGRGDIISVKAGYARNYLLPRGLAVQATASNVKAIERERATLLKRAEAERSDAQSRADRMQGVTLMFERRVGEHGLLYGSVTSMDIAEQLNNQGLEVDRRRITLREPIKETGDYDISIRLHKDVSVSVPVKVVPEGGAAEAAAAATTPATDTDTEASSNVATT